jgi:fucose permease
MRPARTYPSSRLSPRGAVSAVFLTNGALFASLVPRLPELKSDLGLSAGALGAVLLGFGLGGLVGSSGSRWLVPRTGVRLAVAAATVVALTVLPVTAVAPGAGVLFLLLVALGTADGLTDVAMNTSGLVVEARLGRSVLVSMHALWSVGAVLGGLAGSLAIATGVPMTAQLVLVALVVAAVAARAVPAMPEVLSRGTTSGPPRGGRRLALLCVLAVLAAVVEDAPASWSAVYLVDTLHAPEGASGLAFAAFMAAMLVGRLTGDRLVDRFGPDRVVRAGGLLAGASLAVTLVAHDPVVAVAGFGLMGAGAATLFPVLFSAAGTEGAHAVAVMNTVARLGFLAAPVGVGQVADQAGLSGGFALLTLPAAAGVAVLAGAALRRSVHRGEVPPRRASALQR